MNKQENKQLSNNQINTIFYNLKDIYNFHCCELLPDLDSKYSIIYKQNRLQTVTICDLFAKHADKIRYYDYFINNLKESISCLEQLTESQSFFKSQLDAIDKNVTKIRILYLKLKL